MRETFSFYTTTPLHQLTLHTACAIWEDASRLKSMLTKSWFVLFVCFCSVFLLCFNMLETSWIRSIEPMYDQQVRETTVVVILSRQCARYALQTVVQIERLLVQ